MNYKKIYADLVDRSRSRQLLGYSEKHHVVPRCLGGVDTPSNIVELLAREHFIAHQLLIKIFPDSHGLSVAAFLMARRLNKAGSQSKEYGWIRERFAAIHSQRMKEKVFEITQPRLDYYVSRKGIPLSDAHKENVARALRGRVFTPETIAKMSLAANRKPPHSQETKEKISQGLIGNSRRKGIPNSPQLKLKIRNAHLGRKQSQEEKDKRARSRRRISDEAIRAIRADALLGQFTNAQIAGRNGSSSSHVSRILTGKMYSDV